MPLGSRRKLRMFIGRRVGSGYSVCGPRAWRESSRCGAASLRRGSSTLVFRGCVSFCDYRYALVVFWVLPSGFPARIGGMGARSSFERPLVASTFWLLVCVISVVPAEDIDVPLEEQCTPMAIHGCYVIYDELLWHLGLRPDHDHHLNNSAFHIACNNITEKIPCHKLIAKCPQKAEMDITRLERGYQVMREFICDIELFKDFQRARTCEDNDKMVKCDPPPPSENETNSYHPNSERCRITIRRWECREEALRPECSVPLTRAKAAYSKAREAVAFLTGCDYTSSAAPSLVSQSFLMCIITVSFLRWMYAS